MKLKLILVNSASFGKQPFILVPAFAFVFIGIFSLVEGQITTQDAIARKVLQQFKKNRTVSDSL